MIRPSIGLRRRTHLTPYEHEQTRNALAYERTNAATHPLTNIEVDRLHERLLNLLSRAQRQASKEYFNQKYFEEVRRDLEKLVAAYRYHAL